MNTDLHSDEALARIRPLQDFLFLLSTAGRDLRSCVSATLFGNCIMGYAVISRR